MQSNFSRGAFELKGTLLFISILFFSVTLGQPFMLMTLLISALNSRIAFMMIKIRKQPFSGVPENTIMR